MTRPVSSTARSSHAPNPIPTLCHREYMDPVGVCRVCVVQVSKFSKRTGQVEAGRKLLPACQHRVEKTMIVDTVESPDEKAKARLRSAVKILTELLMTDHPSPCVKERQNPGDCELEALARRFGSTAAAARPPRRPSSPGTIRRWSSPSTTTPASSAIAACAAAT